MADAVLGRGDSRLRRPDAHAGGVRADHIISGGVNVFHANVSDLAKRSGQIDLGTVPKVPVEDAGYRRPIFPAEGVPKVRAIGASRRGL